MAFKIEKSVENGKFIQQESEKSIRKKIPTRLLAMFMVDKKIITEKMELISRHSNKLRDRVWLTYLIIGPEGYFRREIDILYILKHPFLDEIKKKKSKN